MKKVTVLTLIMALCAFSVQAQEVTERDTTVFKVTEVMPQYPGGQTEMMAFMGKMEYHAATYGERVQGKVFLQFIVEKDGSISSVHVAKTSGYPELDEVAVSHVRQMPNWKPGSQKGKPVRVQYVLPVLFKL